MSAVDWQGDALRWLCETLLMTLFALGCFAAAQRPTRQRFGWLLSASVAGGLAFAAFYNFTARSAPGASAAAGVVIFITVVLCVRTVTRRRPGRLTDHGESSKPTGDSQGRHTDGR